MSCEDREAVIRLIKKLQEMRIDRGATPAEAAAAAAHVETPPGETPACDQMLDAIRNAEPYLTVPGEPPLQ